MLDDLATAVWRKSTRSSGDAACVEVAQLASDHHAVRDSKNPHGGHLTVTTGQLGVFVTGIRDGQFD